MRRLSLSSSWARCCHLRQGTWVWVFCSRLRKHQPSCLANGLWMRWRMCYVSAGFSCFHLFHHDSSFCFCFCSGTSTSAGSRAENRTETCCDLARVFLDLGLGDHHPGSRSGSGCPCGVPREVGFVNVTETACLSQMTRTICRASA